MIICKKTWLVCDKVIDCTKWVLVYILLEILFQYESIKKVLHGSEYIYKDKLSVVFLLQRGYALKIWLWFFCIIFTRKLLSQKIYSFWIFQTGWNESKFNAGNYF